MNEDKAGSDDPATAPAIAPETIAVPAIPVTDTARAAA